MIRAGNHRRAGDWGRQAVRREAREAGAQGHDTQTSPNSRGNPSELDAPGGLGRQTWAM